MGFCTATVRPELTAQGCWAHQGLRFELYGGTPGPRDAVPADRITRARSGKQGPYGRNVARTAAGHQVRDASQGLPIG